MSIYASMRAIEDELLQKNMFRRIIPKSQEGSKIAVDGRTYVNLSSNDYLALGADKFLAQEFLDTLPSYARRLSSSGSPLLTGAHESYAHASAVCETLFSKKALFFNSGFAANSGVISALAKLPQTLIIADKYAHASIIDGMLSASHPLRYAHNDYAHLERLICKHYDAYAHIVIVTEGIFSMDGDKANLETLVALKAKYPKLSLYVDEAHSFCVRGAKLLGLCEERQVLDKVDFILCTCGKGLGSQGAFLLCNEVARHYFINTVRPLIFSTAMSPLSFEHIAFMLEHLERFKDRQERLERIHKYIHACFAKKGLVDISESQIMALLTYENTKALAAYEFFKARGFYALPIRHPTVPKGQARLRISLSAALSDLEVEALGKAIEEFEL
jgi:8-amino-7-oxononanoate synthase